MLSNPPYGVDWKKYQDPIREEAQTLGTEGRFGAGLPRNVRRPDAFPPAHDFEDAG